MQQNTRGVRTGAGAQASRGNLEGPVPRQQNRPGKERRSEGKSAGPGDACL